MSRNGNNGPSMDLNELLRKHEEYKQRQGRTSPAPRPQPVVPRTEIPPKPVESKPASVEPVYAPPVEEIPEAPQAAPAPAEPHQPEDIQPDAPAAEIKPVKEPATASAEVQDEPAAAQSAAASAPEADDDDVDPNPFDSMFSIFRTAWGKIRKPKDEDDGDENGELIDETEENEASGEGSESADGELSYEEDLLPDDEEQPKRKGLFSWRRKIAFCGRLYIKEIL